MPIRWQAIGDNGPIGEPTLSILNGKKQTLDLANIKQDFSLSILQDFSAPVILNNGQTFDDALRLWQMTPMPLTDGKQVKV